jgi:proline iminopeptidase
LEEFFMKVAQSGKIEVQDYCLHYRTEGSGTPVLVIGSSVYYPRTFSENLRKHFRFIFLDHRGFGSAPARFIEKASFELDVILEDIEKVRQHLELERFIILGHSGHGYMALEYAKKYPQSVSRVILIGMGPDQSALSHQEAEQYLQDSVCPERKKALEEDLKKLPAEIAASPESRFITFCIRLGARSWYDFHFDSTPLWKGVSVNMPVFDHLWGDVFAKIDITRGLKDLKVPVFLALGRYDYLVAPPSSWNPIRRQFFDLTVRVFERSGHTPQFEEPGLFDEELLSWIRSR